MRLAPLLLLVAGCPRVGRLTVRLDLQTGHGSVVAENIGTDDPATADGDFATLVNEYVLGAQLAADHPGWRLGSRSLYERDGVLNGVAEFGFADPVDAGLYRYD